MAVSHEYHSSLAIGLQLISPIAPHIASQLWEGKLSLSICYTMPTPGVSGIHEGITINPEGIV